jgi:hypothetical protein
MSLSLLLMLDSFYLPKYALFKSCAARNVFSRIATSLRYGYDYT